MTMQDTIDRAALRGETANAGARAITKVTDAQADFDAPAYPGVYHQVGQVHSALNDVDTEVERLFGAAKDDEAARDRKEAHEAEIMAAAASAHAEQNDENDDVQNIDAEGVVCPNCGDFPQMCTCGTGWNDAQPVADHNVILTYGVVR